MAKIIDFPKKPFEKEESLDEKEYRERSAKCVEKVLATNKPCDCTLCRDKRLLADRLVTISNYLLSDYVEKSGNKMVFGDWLEVLIIANYKVQDIVFPKE